MPPTNTVKKSVRFSPEAIAILEAYAATHKCNQTEAINEIILNSCHLAPPKLPPSSATQVATQLDEHWQRSIENRLAKLEGSSQLVATDAPIFEIGQVIDGQSNKTYNMLWASFEASQKTSKSTHHLSNKLGVICRVEGKARSEKKKLKVIATFPGDRVHINKDGTFLNEDYTGAIEWFTESSLAANPELKPVKALITLSGDEVMEAILDHPPKKLLGDNTKVLWKDGWLWLYSQSRGITQLFEYPLDLFEALAYSVDTSIAKLKAELDEYNSNIQAIAEATAPVEPTSLVEPTNDVNAIDAVEVASLPQNEPAVEPLTEVVAPLVEDATLVPPTRLAKGELLERFATKLNNPGQLNTLKGNLDSVGLPKLGKGWTAQFDPEGKAWMPEDASREYWVEQPIEVAS